MATTAEIAVEIQSENPLGSRNRIQIKLNATKKPRQ